MEWLEVRIVVPSEWLVEQGRIKTLDCDWQPLEYERSSVTTTTITVIIIVVVFVVVTERRRCIMK